MLWRTREPGLRGSCGDNAHYPWLLFFVSFSFSFFFGLHRESIKLLFPLYPPLSSRGSPIEKPVAQEGLEVEAKLIDSREFPITFLYDYLLSPSTGILVLFALLELGNKTSV